MYIEKLDIKGFGKVKDLVSYFDKGFNIILGGNESGKTTIQWYIKGMLYGLKGGRSSREGLPPPAKRYRPWNGNSFSGSMEYRLDNGNVYKVTRNFSSNAVCIYDALFNDITDTFELSREKGVQFAEKHLGLNEACFDKTVFIRQMETRIDEDGGKELVNRLMNVSQTGFEDISFKRAREALKNALINYTGTEKTTTRPLDRISFRLQELKAVRSSLLEKKDSLLKVELELKNLYAALDAHKEKNTFLTKLMDVVRTKKSIEKDEAVKNELANIYKLITNDKMELDELSKRIDELNREIELLSAYAAFDAEDADEISLLYTKYQTLIEDEKKLLADMERKKDEIRSIEGQAGPSDVFAAYGSNMEDEILQSKRKLDRLKNEYEKHNINIINEKIKSARHKSRILGFNSAFFAFLTVLFAVTGFMNTSVRYFGYTAALLALTATVVFLISGRKASRELTDAESQKRLSFVAANSIAEEIALTQENLNSILRSAGAEDTEDLLKLKALYESRVQKITYLNMELNRIENEHDSCLQRIAGLKKLILDKLVQAGMAESYSSDITDEYIRKFKQNIRRYEECKPSITYAVQRSSDLNGRIGELYRKVSSLTGTECSDLNEILKAIEALASQINISRDTLSVQTEQLDSLSQDCPDFITEFGRIDSIMSEQDLTDMEEHINACLSAADAELNKILLDIKENETLIRNSNVTEEDLQQIEEEIWELEARKSNLEEINISLKTALDTLEEASLEIQKDYFPVLSGKMAGYINKITSGKYRDLRADNRFSLNTVVPETGEVLGVSLLSAGTVDQMYLALRLAIADMVSSTGESLPLVMDEIFSQYDDTRTRETIEFLYGISSSSQVVLFTCKSREVDIAREICGNHLNIIEL